MWVIAVHRPPKGLSDPLLYQRFAQGIADGHGYVSFLGKPTAYYPPGYPYFLGALQWLADLLGLDGSLPLVAGLAQAILGGVAAAALVVAGRQLGGRLGDGRAAERIGVAAGAVLALWPNLVLYSGVLLSETLYIAAFSVFIAALSVALRPEDAPGFRPHSAMVVAAGALGIATLVRPQVLVVVPAIGAAFLLARRAPRTALRDLAVLAGGVVIVLTPWAIRNAVVLDAFVPLSNNGGDNLCVGFHPGASGHFEVPAYCDTGEFYIDGPGAERRRNAETTRLALRWAAANPGSLPALSARKLWYTYRGEDDGLRALESYEADRFLPPALRSTMKAALVGSYLVIMGAAVVGGAGLMLLAWRRRGREVLVTATLLMTAASALVPIGFFGDPRFKVATTPLFALLAAAGMLSRRWWTLSPAPEHPPTPGPSTPPV